MRAAFATLLLVLPLVAGAPASAAETPGRSVARFVTPRPMQTVLGEAKARIEVLPASGLRPVSVELLVDGKPAGTKKAPPWEFAWDAGAGERGHDLAARIAMSDGTTIVAEVRTSPLRIQEVEEVAFVNVYAVAKTQGGRYVTDLGRDDFRLYENDRPQVIERFTAERKPLRIALVLDTSYSMEGSKLRATQSAAVALLDVLDPQDEGMVIGFSDGVRVLEPLTSDHRALEAAIRSTEAKGGTALYDAIWTASEALQQFEGRRVLVLLSDGRDEAGSGLEPGSLRTLDEAIDRALRDEVMVFAIGLGDAIARDADKLAANPTAVAEEMDFYGRRSLVGILRQITEMTGGRAIFTPGPSKLRRSFEEVASDLRHQYSLAYISTDEKRDGKWRAIRLETTRAGVVTAARRGYYAPKDPLLR